MLPATTTRVPEHTQPAVNEEIRKQTEANIAHYSSGGVEAINQRLEELDREWDIERALEANASAISLIGLALGATVNRKWFILPAVVTGFLLLHAMQGWCPPVPLLRRMGFRTSAEIDYERYALKALRGDFKDVPTGTDGMSRVEAGELIEAVQR